MNNSAQPFRRILASTALACMMLCICGTATAQGTEYQHKAAIIMGIVRNTDWPSTKLKPESPIVIGVSGSELAADKMREAIANRLYKGRTVVVKRITAPQEIDGCHVVFASNTDEATTRAILRRTSGDPILTFGETLAFAEKGGIFVLQNSGIGPNPVRTLLHEKNLRRSELKINDEALTSARVENIERR